MLARRSTLLLSQTGLGPSMAELLDVLADNKGSELIREEMNFQHKWMQNYRINVSHIEIMKP